MLSNGQFRKQALSHLPACPKDNTLSAQRDCSPYTSSWITSPERSFGSNHVAFGGIMLPESAISIICFMDTG